MKLLVKRQSETAAKPKQTDVTEEYPVELNKIRKLSRILPKS